jgi:hypothetical protein
MSEANKNPVAETQQQRWVKYGLNVALTCVVVVVLAGLVVYLAQRKSKRIDVTGAGVYSLKPQTLNVIGDLKQPIKIVSLYTKSEAGAKETDYAQVVADLLDEYKRKGKNIDVELIDPVAQPTKVDDLIKDVTNKYGGEIAQYRQVVQDYPKVYDTVKGLAVGEAKKVAALPLEQMQGNNDVLQSVVLALITVQEMPKQLEQVKDRVEQITKAKLPDWRGAVDRIDSGMQTLSTMTGQIVDDFGKAKEDAKVPAEVRKYIADSLPRYEEMKKSADAMHGRISKLGELKLDDLRQQLRERNSILVMSDKDMRTLPVDKVWQADKDVRQVAMTGGEIKPRFAGEQQISTAILSLTRDKKQRVAFVRPGGPPLAGGASQFDRPGPLSRVANRLRDYNFDVVEKDLSGMYAMQAQMQGMPGPKEPSDEELKDAVWVVFAYPVGRNPMGMPPQPIAPKVAEHLKNGGSALIIPFPQGEDLGEALVDYGIRINNNVIAVHEKLDLNEGSEDIERVKQFPFVFLLNDYGDHPMTRPLKSLDGLFAPILSVSTFSPQSTTRPTTQPSQTAKTQQILPVPGLMRTWGETDIASLESGGQPKFEPDKGDVAPPLFGGATSEKGTSRVAVIGGPQFAFNAIVSEPDPALLRKNLIVSRFPGNAELFQNAIFWLAHEDTMLAISPTAMETPRIKDMSEGTLKAWRVGVLLVGLPMLVIIAGLGVYFARRD